MRQITGVTGDMFLGSEIKAKPAFGWRKGILSWQGSPTGVHPALLSWCPAIPGFDVVISDTASPFPVVSQSGAVPTTSCFAGTVRSAFFGLHVIGRACSHQVLDRLRPLGPTFPRSGVIHVCRFGHPRGWWSLLSASAVTCSDMGGREQVGRCEEPEMLHLSFPSLEKCSPWGSRGGGSSAAAVYTRGPAPA